MSRVVLLLWAIMPDPRAEEDSSSAYDGPSMGWAQNAGVARLFEGPRPGDDPVSRVAFEAGRAGGKHQSTSARRGKLAIRGIRLSGCKRPRRMAEWCEVMRRHDDESLFGLLDRLGRLHIGLVVVTREP